MGKLSTHVLDTTRGKPGQGITIHLSKIINNLSVPILSAVTNQDGRCDQPLLQGEEFEAAEYQMEFLVGEYFEKFHNDLPNPPFLNKVVIRFNVSNSNENYHVPLVVTPWSYSTYRGS
ncbi:MAG: hydroxyisourate hydrolase [Betaproteobacteria bacterium]|jgi:5-hydroxyisourate hydrolase